MNEPPPYWATATGTNASVGPKNWSRRLRYPRSRWIRCVGLIFLAWVTYLHWTRPTPPSSHTARGLSIQRLQKDLATCSTLRTKPTDPIGLGREKNARYVDGHKATLIKNATVWTGEPREKADPRLGESYSWVSADVFLENGLIKHVGRSLSQLHELPSDTLVYDAQGRPLTAGIIDMHSHAGVHSLPTLHGNEDVSELSTNITPYVRSTDGIHPLDRQIQAIKSGGVTTSLILPGSSNNIGGEAFVIKHAVGTADGRNETSVADMLADPERTWRYMKMACGENAKHVHGKIGERGPMSRLGESWEIRRAFETATRILREQEDWCDMAALGLEHAKGYLPYDIEWEALVAVLRGQVQVHIHCYTIPDLEAFVDHSNEFEFKIRAFHHAHQAYLVPQILKRAWGDDPPASALFADNMWYKAEAYISSEYAGKHLYDSGLTPIYVSDNPILNAQHLVLEAAKGYRYGLPYHAALAAVTSGPAERLGLGQRLGKVKPGFDADIVVWDSDPLSVGATPMQVWVDGTAQYEDPVKLDKPLRDTIVPNEKLAKIIEDPVRANGDVVFTGVSEILSTTHPRTSRPDGTFNVAISAGKIVCVGVCDSELQTALFHASSSVIHLANGSLTPAFTAFGSTLGLNAVESEKVTDNGVDGETFSRGIDGLALDTNKLHTSHRYGVTRAISSPKFVGEGTHHGTSVGFNTAASSSISPGALFSEDAALHYTLDLSIKRSGDTPSISAAVGRLRHKLLNAVAGNLSDTKAGESQFSEGAFLRKVVAGELPLVITVHSSDVIAAVLRTKVEVEKAISEAGGRAKLRLVLNGASEAHLLASDLATARVGVVLAPLLSYGVSWDQRRALTGAPLTNATVVDALISAGVVTAIGLEEDWIVRDLSLLAAIAYTNSGGKIDAPEAMGLISRNIYKMLGLEEPKWFEHFVVHEGSPLQIDSRVKAVGDGTGHLHIF
ncbi:uncharacterized protein DNG_09443 [Cephalotrichum gorgonifer]|uniref:Amidohydrolase-related domain-containing protein n=1 Tax=Cephalotrichum gorgonifer TaxID=2041049 RepID=A0AAE8SZD3_9PEZI|nr:uncharacterized protein DNG_09443 [Cephalotrichum gorgonifer]